MTGAPRPVVPALAQPAASTNAVTDMPSATAPATSNRRPERPAMWGTATMASARAMSPTGMLIQKTQRQPQASVMIPPARGPTRIATGNAAPMIDRIRGRSRGVVTSPMIVCGMSCSPAEPMPWPIRASVSCVMSCAKPHSSDAMRNSDQAREEDEPRADEIGELAEHG